MSRVDPYIEKVKIIKIVIEPYHKVFKWRGIYEDFKLKKTFVLYGLHNRFNPLTAGAAYIRVFIFY